MPYPRSLVAWIKALILASVVAPGTAAAQTDQESEAWAAARFLNTPAAYQWYLEMFPNGRYAMEAFEQIAENVEPQAGNPDAPVAGSWDWELDTELAEGAPY